MRVGGRPVRLAALLLSFVPLASWPSIAAAQASSRPPSAGPPTADAARANAAGDRVRQAEQMLERGDFKAAEPILAELAAATPGDAKLQFDLGFCREHNGEDAAAAQAYAAAIAADSTLPEPHAALGLLEARQGHVGAAQTQLELVAGSAAATPSLRARALRALARLNEAGNPAHASDELLQAVQLTGEEPGDAELTASLAARNGDRTEAEAAYRKVLSATPDDLDATIGLAALLERDGKLAEADALLTPALAAHPESAQLNARAAAVYAAEGKDADATALIKKLRDSDPKLAADPALTRMLAHLDLIAGNVADAEPLYRSLAVANPGDPALLDDLGSTLVRESKFAEAQAVLARAVGLRSAFHDDTAWAETAGHLAFAASRNHQPEVALQALSARATVLPNSPASLFLDATSHDALHQYKQAAASYRAFLAVANGKLPDEEFEARHRLVALEHEH